MGNLYVNVSPYYSGHPHIESGESINWSLNKRDDTVATKTVAYLFDSSEGPFYEQRELITKEEI